MWSLRKSKNGLLEWFLNHPALRYGGYCLIALMFFIPFSHIIDIFKSSKKLKQKAFIIVLIGFMIFSFRNVLRINKEVEIYGYNFLYQPYHYIDERHFRVQKQINSLIIDYKNCKKEQSVCNKKIGSNIIISNYGKFIITQNAK